MTGEGTPNIMSFISYFILSQRIRFVHGPIQMLLCGVSLTFMVPAACSIFPQRWYVWLVCQRQQCHHENIYFPQACQIHLHCSFLLVGKPNRNLHGNLRQAQLSYTPISGNLDNGQSETERNYGFQHE